MITNAIHQIAVESVTVSSIAVKGAAEAIMTLESAGLVLEISGADAENN